MVTQELQTRDKILHAAFALFLEKGYENTPVQAIIDAVGIAKGTFYHHFQSKEEMLVALVEETGRRVIDAVAPIVADPSLNAPQKMLATARTSFARKVEDIGPETLVLARQMRSKANRLLADSIEDLSSQWLVPVFGRIIRQGVAEGYFHVTNPEWATELVLGAVMGMTNHILDLFIALGEGNRGAIDRLIDVYRSIEEAMERILGAAPGSLPLYTSQDVRGFLTRFAETMSLPGGKR